MNISKLISSPLNWYGGKGSNKHKRVLKCILSKIKASNKSIIVDVFGGSSTIALNCENKVIIYNDKFDGLYNFFNVIKYDGETLTKKIDNTLYCEREYNVCRKNWKYEKDCIEKARMFYVATMQGMFNTTGSNSKNFKRSKKYAKKRNTTSLVGSWRNNIEVNLPRCIDKVKNIEVWNIDALKCIDICNSEDYVLYLDPPYIKSTRSSKKDVYEHEYTDEDHIKLIEKLKTIKASVILSGYQNDLYDELLKFGWSKKTNFTKKSKEVLWYKL
ncbi:MAG: DNA adenine methylase [Peptostreptococcaceae bacterium]